MKGTSGIGYAAEKFTVIPLVEDKQKNTLLIALHRDMGSSDYLRTKDDEIHLMRLIFFGLLPACILISGASVFVFRKKR